MVINDVTDDIRIDVGSITLDKHGCYVFRGFTFYFPGKPIMVEYARTPKLVDWYLLAYNAWAEEMYAAA